MAPPRTKRPPQKNGANRIPNSSLSCVHPNEARREKEKDHRISKRYISKRRICANKQPVITEERIHELLETLKNGLKSDNAETVLGVLHEMRGGLADSEHIDTVLQGDVMPLLDDCLEHSKLDVRYSAIWILTNVACGDTEQTALVAQRVNKVVPILTEATVNDNVLAQCLWMFANIAGDSAELRDVVIQQSPLELIESFVREDSSAQVLENVAWLLSNIARQGQLEGADVIGARVLAILNRIFKCARCDCRVITEMCRAVLQVLHNLGEPDTLETVKQSGVMCGLVRHSTLDCDRSCFAEMVKLVADLLSSDNDSCQTFIDQGALSVLSIIMHEEINELYYYACFAIANVFACSSTQIQCAINHNLLSAAIHHLEHGDFKVQREAAIALCSFVGAAQDRQVLQAFNKGFVPPLVQMLRYYDTSVVYDVLASLFNLLDFARERGMEDEFFQEMLDGGLKGRVLNLKQHGHDQISDLAQSFIDQYLTSASVISSDDKSEDILEISHRLQNDLP